MTQYIKNIFDFIYSFFNEIISYINGNATISTNFLNTKIFDGTLININLTYSQLMFYVIPTVFAILFIFLFVKFVLKLFNLFKF